MVMNCLLQKAGDLDKELRLYKTSKEAKAAALKSEHDEKKTKKGQLRWQDPW